MQRHRATPEQGDLSLHERFANVEHAISATSTGRSTLPGKVVLLIDDVMTSGATLAAASEACLAAGAAEIRVLVLARAIRDA